MMDFTTHIHIPKSEVEIEVGAKILLLGSCFADEVGQKMQQGGFDAMVNPFGTLYNPASIAASLLRTISEKKLPKTLPVIDTQGKAREAFKDSNGVWHSWMHHSRFSASTYEELAAKVNETTDEVKDFLGKADVLIITLGTAIIYRLKDSGMLVANCHKQLDTQFERQRLSPYDIADQWQMLLQLLESINPKMKIIFTVSPIRHKRDGLHVNQISKGILLQAVDELCSNSKCEYFPAYEIMLDELRDYRFYADDMIHPSAVAVEYIWQRFQDTYFNNKTKDAVAKARKAFASSQHRKIID